VDVLVIMVRKAVSSTGISDYVWAAICLVLYDNADHVCALICRKRHSSDAFLIRVHSLLEVIKNHSRLNGIWLASVPHFISYCEQYCESRKSLGELCTIFSVQVVDAHHTSMKGKTRCIEFSGPWDDTEFFPGPKRTRILEMFCSWANFEVSYVLENSFELRKFAMGLSHHVFSQTFCSAMVHVQQMECVLAQCLERLREIALEFRGPIEEVSDSVSE
jgi:hypothetical protein